MRVNPRVAEDRGIALAECVLALGVLLGALIALGQPPRQTAPPGAGRENAAIRATHHPGLNPAP